MRTAIILFNLGGPDRPEAIKPFRINLFSDKAIIRAPIFIRFWLARLIAASSAKAAVANYTLLGGKSPLLAHTEAQGRALEAALGPDYKCFPVMRYWHPLAHEVAPLVKSWKPDRILLLPLYPQFSTTTTGSSLNDWREAAANAGLACPTATLCCWHDDPGYTAAIAALVDEQISAAQTALPGAKLRILYSAHGLPESIVKGGDPYQAHIEASVAAVQSQLAENRHEHVICYQSRATPQKWLSPSTVEALEQAGRDKVAVVVVPIAFVSDHIETLVELDIENRHLAREAGVAGYFRARAPNDDPAFITAVAGIVKRAAASGLCRAGTLCQGHRHCPWSTR
ncbi:ferrochelatase [Acidocella sp.]|uniref:ferrochelatase n=1 Tax=Acidocella sp. TaxID=50710 RepID=UPI00261F1E32|nr:ferrochelatase [Acidocella sp.]